MKIELTSEHFKEIHKKGYNLDVIFVLKMVQDGEDIDELALSSVKMDDLCTLVRRKGLVSMDKLTKDGEALLAFLSSKGENVKLVKKKPSDDIFNSFWKEFPGTDTFSVGNMKFEGTRALKTKKEDCKVKLHKILAEGEYTIDEIIGALKLEVKQKIENSMKTGQNKMSYFQNSFTWLHQRSFEPFIELIKKGHKIQDTSPVITGTDI